MMTLISNSKNQKNKSKEILKFFLIGLLLLFVCYPASAEKSFFYQWLELGPNNAWIVRVVSDKPQCPVIKIRTLLKTSLIQMAIKSTADKNFPVTVCQAILDSSVISADIINHRAIILPLKNPQKIMIIGDTGCPLKTPSCRYSSRWPFHEIALQGAKFKPDLVIHAGDYIYRQSSSLTDKNITSANQDNWSKWEKDFFRPASPLLKTASWIFVRGDHESCQCNGAGWEKLLSPFAFKHCYHYSPLYNVNIGNTNLFIMDSSSASDSLAPANEVSWFSQYLRQLSIPKNPAQYNWLISHKPVWFINKDNLLNTAYQIYSMNTLQSAWMRVNPPSVNLIISGHLPCLQIINFNKNRPSQLIVGSSGTALDKSLNKTDLQRLTAAGMPISEGLSMPAFGFMLMKKSGNNDWAAQFCNPKGKIIKYCHFDGQQFTCRAK